MKQAIVKYIKETPEIIDVKALAALHKNAFTPSTVEEKEGFKNTIIDLEMKKDILNFPIVTLQCELLIENIPTEFASALLRASISETPHYALEIDYKNIFKTDQDINISMLSNIINNCVLIYGLTDEEVDKINMYLDITNNTSEPIMVKCGDISFTGPVKPKSAIFFPTNQITQLAPKRQLKINHLKLVRGISTQHSKFSIAVNGRIWPTEIPENFTSRLGYLDKYKINFKVNAINPNHKKICNRIIAIGIETLIERIIIIKEIIIEENKLKVEKYENYISVKIEETNTIAQMLQRAFDIIYPNVTMMYALLTYTTGFVEIKVVGSDSKIMLIKVLDECIKFYKNLLDQI